MIQAVILLFTDENTRPYAIGALLFVLAIIGFIMYKISTSDKSLGEILLDYSPLGLLVKLWANTFGKLWAITGGKLFDGFDTINNNENVYVEDDDDNENVYVEDDDDNELKQKKEKYT
jgi:hypothetical protein